MDSVGQEHGAVYAGGLGGMPCALLVCWGSAGYGSRSPLKSVVKIVANVTSRSV